jgi:hypothetical protein
MNYIVYPLMNYSGYPLIMNKIPNLPIL